MPNEQVEDGAKQWLAVPHVAKFLRAATEEANDIFCSSVKPETELSTMPSSITIDGKLFVLPSAFSPSVLSNFIQGPFLSLDILRFFHFWSPGCFRFNRLAGWSFGRAQPIFRTPAWPYHKIPRRRNVLRKRRKDRPSCPWCFSSALLLPTGGM
jgi:hypothetical protein